MHGSLGWSGQKFEFYIFAEDKSLVRHMRPTGHPEQGQQACSRECLRECTMWCLGGS